MTVLLLIVVVSELEAIKSSLRSPLAADKMRSLLSCLESTKGVSSSSFSSFGLKVG